jgi:hypothetical protein
MRVLVAGGTGAIAGSWFLSSPSAVTRSSSSRARGASNVRAKDLLGWTPEYRSWRDGFIAELERKRTAAAA